MKRTSGTRCSLLNFRSESKSIPEMAKHINHNNYLLQVAGIETSKGLTDQATHFRSVMQKISPKMMPFSYAPGKWTIGQLIGHISDTERIMAYRALCFARGETSELPPFDEDAYVLHASFEGRNKRSLTAEFYSVRNATLTLYHSLTEEQKSRSGRFSGNQKSVEEIFRIILGHTQHHLSILKERYL